MFGLAKNTWWYREAVRKQMESSREVSESILREEHVSLSCSPLLYKQAGRCTGS